MQIQSRKCVMSLFSIQLNWSKMCTNSVIISKDNLISKEYSFHILKHLQYQWERERKVAEVIIWNRKKNKQFSKRRVLGRTHKHTQTRRERNASFCRELIVLPGACVWSLDTYFNLSPIHHFVGFLCRNFIPSKALYSNIISCDFIDNANGIFQIVGVLSFTSFCREQAKRSHCNFSCRARAFASVCWAQGVMIDDFEPMLMHC